MHTLKKIYLGLKDQIVQIRIKVRIAPREWLNLETETDFESLANPVSVNPFPLTKISLCSHSHKETPVFIRRNPEHMPQYDHRQNK